MKRQIFTNLMVLVAMLLGVIAFDQSSLAVDQCRILTNVPYIQQVLDMNTTEFLGHNACGPASAVMALQYFGLQPVSPNPSYPGWYVYKPYQGFTDKSGNNYSTELSRDWDMPKGTHPHLVPGAHGLIVDETKPTVG